jgi:hypothetical protein
MRYIKQFESIKHFPDIKDIKVGDYVAIKVDRNRYNSEFCQFLDNNISEVTESALNDKNAYIIVKFNIPFKKSNFFCFFIDEIDYWSSNKGELQLKLDARKYNL